MTTAASATLLGLVWGPDFASGWVAVGWLAVMSIGCTVVGWLLIGGALHRLSADVGAALLVLQPLVSLLLAVIVLSERPTSFQLFGCALVIAVVWFVRRESKTEPTSALSGTTSNVITQSTHPDPSDRHR